MCTLKPTLTKYFFAHFIKIKLSMTASREMYVNKTWSRIKTEKKILWILIRCLWGVSKIFRQSVLWFISLLVFKFIVFWRRWEQKWSNMWIQHNFTQQITSGIQRQSPCCGQSLQFATALLWLSVLSRQVSPSICTVIANPLKFTYVCLTCFFRMGWWLRVWDWRSHRPVEGVWKKWNERQLCWEVGGDDGPAFNVVSSKNKSFKLWLFLNTKFLIRWRQFSPQSL